MATQRKPAAGQKKLPVVAADVAAAVGRIKGAVKDTPCLESQTLGAMLSGRLWLKFENQQFTASFKERGALNCLLQLSAEQKARGVVAMSAGNHAQGVAYHAKRLGIGATIVMPKGTPTVKVRNTEHHGARVVLTGDTLDRARDEALLLAKTQGLTFVHPYDDPAVIAGQGTIAHEMLAIVPDLDLLVVPVGGGGLISGMAVAAKALKPSIRIVGVQSERNPSMALAVEGKKLEVAQDSLAEGIAVKVPGVLATEIVRALVDEIVVVPERAIEQAIARLIEIEKTVAEGAGAAGLAALLHKSSLAQGKRVGIPICGGNIDTRLLSSILERSLAHDGRLTELSITVPDRPGQLHRITTVCAAEDANIVEIVHERTHSAAGAKDVIVEIEVETRDGQHLDRLLKALEAVGFKVHVMNGTA
jgi:threonine dehydratase